MENRRKFSLASAVSDKSGVKKYIGYFKWAFLITGCLIAFYTLVLIIQSTVSGASAVERTNTETLTTERVFDWGDVLTDAEEGKLRRLIAKRERQTGCDIVLVTLNESLADYATAVEPYVPYSEFVRIYAEDFYDGNRFGYDRPVGDGVLLLDNWYRETDGHVYTWLCTTGRVKQRYTAARIDHLLDNVYRYVEKNPYRAYRTYIEEFYHDMAGTGFFTLYVPGVVPVAAGLITAAVFILLHLRSRAGSRTTTAATYVEGGRPQLRVRNDIFLNRTVVTRHIERSSGGGHGGGHGGGGGSHGGGGHSR